MNASQPSRGEVWDLNLDPTKGREQAGNRPALILSVNLFNHGAAELVVVVPITRTER
jgi:mRNA interferase MazF